MGAVQSWQVRSAPSSIGGFNVVFCMQGGLTRQMLTLPTGSGKVSMRGVRCVVVKVFQRRGAWWPKLWASSEQNSFECVHALRLCPA